MQTTIKNLLLVPALFVTLFTHAQRLQVEDRSSKNEESREVDSWTAHLDQDVSYCMSTYSDFIKKTFDVKTSKLQITSEQPMDGQLDGEYFSPYKMEIEILPNKFLFRY